MTFLDQLRSWLAGPRVVSRVASVMGETNDVSRLRAVLFDVLAAMERDGAEASHQLAPEPTVQTRVRDLHTRWVARGVLERFAAEVRAELRDGLGAGATEEAVEHLLIDTLLFALGKSVEHRPLVERLELQRLAGTAQPSRSPWHQTTPEQYAAELGLVRASGRFWSLSALGETFMTLRGRGAVRWLLTVECASSVGPSDSFRTCREAFQRLGGPRSFVIDQSGDDDTTWPFEWDTLLRLSWFGVVVREDLGGPYERITLRDDWAPFVKELAEGHMTPFASLAETLLARESEAALRANHVVGAVDRSAEIVAAQVRHTKMVVHEIRNALVPVQHALRALYAAVEGAVPAEEVDRHRALIDPGIDRLFHFVAELKQTADLAAKLPDPFDPLEAAREAVAIVRQGLQLDVTLPTPAEAWRVRGDRNRFVLACVNLLRNAAQASERPSAAVHVEALRNASGERLVLAFDDDGPGVPEAHRETIFQSGFALRAEGTGQGLALVREVVEVELGGVVRCEASAKLGGARFVVVVPIDGRTEP